MDPSRGRVSLESDLHAAIEAGQFELHYQPKADTESGDVYSAEALIRWRHPQRGLIEPDEFIPLAEECGLINEIGAWVLREACRQCAEWQRNGLPALRVAVNVAATQFRRGDLLEVVRGALAGRGARGAVSRDRAHRERGDDQPGGVRGHSRAVEPHGRAGVGR